MHAANAHYSPLQLLTKYPYRPLPPGDDGLDTWGSAPLRRPVAPPPPPPTRRKPTYEAWYGSVSAYMETTIGLSPDDLADQPWQIWYDEGLSPRAAAKEALAEEGFGSMDLF